MREPTGRGALVAESASLYGGAAVRDTLRNESNHSLRSVTMDAEPQIERKETGIRIGLTVLFVLILRVVEIVLGAIVIFQLLFALITKRAPGERIARFANRIITYVTQLLRYVTYQDDQRPFPFSDFPAATDLADATTKPNGRAPTSLGEPSEITGPY